jgi:murein DD-endopeptidase MepM/ murein hydrolase activator NlpD
VKSGQVIAQSDSTGLAAGDHLQFSVILQGEQVDAREWWDGHWISDRIAAKLREFGADPAAGGGEPASSASPSP